MIKMIFSLQRTDGIVWRRWYLEVRLACQATRHRCCFPLWRLMIISPAKSKKILCTDNELKNSGIRISPPTSAPDQARDSTERWKRAFAFFSDLLQLICKQIALPCVRERESCLIFYPRFKKLSSLKEHKSQWTSRHPRFQSIWVLKPTQVDVDHFPPLRPFPRGHYCSKKCRQAKKAEARRGRFALWGKTAAREHNSDGWIRRHN